ncbi:MAG: hypothetical protein IT384_06510 [Deltaproteobacteria bacterium]|nr:hypothetical protein [Deltaproteobacteria bacterium]
MNWNTIKLAVVATSVAALGVFSGCSSDDGDSDAGVTDTGGRADAMPAGDATTHPDATTTPDGGTAACPAWAGAQPAGTVAINFTIDDSANQTYTNTSTADGLAWKGSMNYDSASRCITRDPSWGGGTGPYTYVYDDGPWSAGGHEPAGSTAGDHIFGVTVFFLTPTTEQAFEYGAVSGWRMGQQGNWIWSGTNGTFTVPAGATTPITATGLVIPAFGTIDLKLEIDTSTLAPDFLPFDPLNEITVKGSSWGWIEIATVDTGTAGDETAGDGVRTFVLGEHAGRDPIRHSGLLKRGDEPEFVFVLNGVEYKVAAVPPTQGVTAYVKTATAADWSEVSVQNRTDAMNKNTYITVP